MSTEFFLRDWLKARPVTYLWTHLLIMPLVDLYATACDWLAAGAAPPRGLFWFLLISFLNGLAMETGRKIRARQDEEPGVETYTCLWGRRTAVGAWLAALFLTALCGLVAAWHVDFTAPAAAVIAPALLAATVVAVVFLRQPVTRRARLFEAASGLWTLLLYLSLGVLPLLLRGGGIQK